MAADTSDAIITRKRLWAEFSALYIGAPLAIALFLPPRQMFTALILFSLAGLVLLWRTGGFEWRSLVRGWRRLPWAEVALIAVLTLVTGALILWATRPDALFALARSEPLFLLVIWSLYPLLSALPQELIFRPLFFHRFGSLFPDMRTAILVNAAIFSFAHLMYWSVIVTVLTFAGGLVFARAYVGRGFPAAWVLHAVAGNVIFAVGMGAYFYTGNVVRPF